MGAAMRGDDEIFGSLFSYINLENRVLATHPLRPIREIANAALVALSADFAALYAGTRRPSVPPEKPLRAMLLQAFYSVRSEWQLIERIEFDLLFRWFGHPHRRPGVGTIRASRRTATGCSSQRCIIIGGRR
jgi:transposase